MVCMYAMDEMGACPFTKYENNDGRNGKFNSPQPLFPFTYLCLLPSGGGGGGGDILPTLFTFIRCRGGAGKKRPGKYLPRYLAKVNQVSQVGGKWSDGAMSQELYTRAVFLHTARYISVYLT